MSALRECSATVCTQRMRTADFQDIVKDRLILLMVLSLLMPQAYFKITMLQMHNDHNATKIIGLKFWKCFRDHKTGMLNSGTGAKSVPRSHFIRPARSFQMCITVGLNKPLMYNVTILEHDIWCVRGKWVGPGHWNSSHSYATQYVQAHLNNHVLWEWVCVKFNYKY